jgi:two-component system NtrC family sensor kinase
MRLAYKLAVALTLGVLIVMGIYAYIQIRLEVVLFDADVPRNARIGRALRGTVSTVWRAEGEERARGLIEEADDETSEVAIRLVWADAPAGHPRRPKLDDAELRALATGREARVVLEDAAGDPVRHTYVPLGLEEAPDAALEIRESLRPQTTFIRMTRRGIALATVATTTVCGLIAVCVLSWFVARPMRILREQAHRLGAGDFSHRLRLRQRDEIGDLAADLNDTCERMAEASRQLASATDAKIAALEQLRHTDRRATIGRLASGIAHELGTPLNVVSLRAQEIAAADSSSEQVTSVARIIDAQARRMSEIIRQLLDFSGRRKPKLGTSHLADIVSRTMEFIAPVADKARVTFVCDLPQDHLLVNADQNQIQQALTNVVLNGIQAMPEGGRLTIRVARRWSTPPADCKQPPGDYCAIAIEDEGPGIPADAVEQIFEPFFTTKGAGSGTGLGLPVAAGIVTDHGGWIGVESLPARGTRFTIFLPLVERPANGLTAVAS